MNQIKKSFLFLPNIFYLTEKKSNVTFSKLFYKISYIRQVNLIIDNLSPMMKKLNKIIKLSLKFTSLLTILKYNQNEMKISKFEKLINR